MDSTDEQTPLVKGLWSSGTITPLAKSYADRKEGNKKTSRSHKCTNFLILRTTLIHSVHSWLACLWIVAKNQRHEWWLSWRLEASCKNFLLPSFRGSQNLHREARVQFPAFRHWNKHISKPCTVRSNFVVYEESNPIDEMRDQIWDPRLYPKITGGWPSTMQLKSLTRYVGQWIS